LADTLNVIAYTPHPYQARITEMIESGASCAVWAEMGLGKTVATLTAVNNLVYDYCLPVKALVLSGKAIAEHTWSDELRKWNHLRYLRLVKLTGTAVERAAALDGINAAPHGFDIAVMCRNNIQWLFDRYTKKLSHGKWQWDNKHVFPFNLIILDETVGFRTPSGAWFKTLARIVKHTACQVVELTGTPAPNSIEQLWGQIYLLDKGERLETSITRFRQMYMEPDKILYTGGYPVVASYKPRAGAKEIIMDKLSDITVALRAEDWLKMPDRVVNDLRVTLPDAAMKAYRKMERTALLELQGETITAGSAAGVVNKLLQFCNGRAYTETRDVVTLHRAKLDMLCDLVESVLSPVLVFYEFLHDRDAILAEIAAQTLPSSPEIIDRWNAGEIPVLLAHPASAGHGLNLQGGGHTIIWYGLTYNLEYYQQANARLWRQGQQAPSVIIHRLLSAGTVDEAVAAVLERKDTVQASILDAVKYKIEKEHYQ